MKSSLDNLMKSERWSDVALSREISSRTEGKIQVTPITVGNYRRGITTPTVDIALVIGDILGADVRQIWQPSVVESGTQSLSIAA
jgi:hypothetical protein